MDDTPKDPTEEESAPATTKAAGKDEEKGTRRMLQAMLGILAAAAIGLLILLLWLLRPSSSPAAGDGPGGDCVRTETSIYGFGERAGQRLKHPLGVGFDGGGNVWISDTGNSRVLVFTTGGAFVRELGTDEGEGKLYSPYGIAADPERDRMYVADWTNQRVQIFTTAGEYAGYFPADDQKLKVFGPNGFSPYDVQVLEGRVVVSSNDGLYFFDLEGHVLARWGGETRGVEPGMFNFPDSFVSDPATGRIYVADTMNRRIVALDKDGKWLWVSGKPDVEGSIKGFWQLPRGIDLGPDGNLYVIDTFRFDTEGQGTGHIVVVQPDGKLVAECGRAGTEEDAFNFPEQIAVTPDGLFAVADRENSRVLLFRMESLPAPDKLEEQTYERSFSIPKDVWATPSP